MSLFNTGNVHLTTYLVKCAPTDRQTTQTGCWAVRALGEVFCTLFCENLNLGGTALQAVATLPCVSLLYTKAGDFRKPI